MIGTALLQRAGGYRVQAGVIGSGRFGHGIIVQAPRVPCLDVPVVADRDLHSARQAYRDAGIAESQIAACDSPAAARRALDAGQRIVTDNPSILIELPLDIVVEATGIPEAGARHAAAAIDQGMHVAMVTKETDVAVGPILKNIADEAGVVYTAVDGDQHGLLIGLVNWARMAGLEVICGGKALDSELVYDPSSGSLRYGARAVKLSETQRDLFRPPRSRTPRDVVAARREALGHLACAANWDLTELAIAANGTGLCPDSEIPHCPAVYTTEVPDIMRATESGGILQGEGVIDSIVCLRQPHEGGLGGGVFIVVRIHNKQTRHFLNRKGLVHSSDGTFGLILHPHHLLGIEAIGSILAAALLESPTGAVDYRPRVDTVVNVTRPMKAGEIIGDDHSPDLAARIVAASALGEDRPIPAQLANGNRLAADVPAGSIITGDMLVPAGESLLWSLRRRQDRHFQTGAAG